MLNIFAYCGITSIVIPNSVKTIDMFAFRRCYLRSVTIPNSVTDISSSAFEDCTSLTSVTIPNSVKSIGSAAFMGCRSLTSVTIPNSVEFIIGSAFWGCSGLTSVTIGNNVKSIGSTAFKGCVNLETIYCLAEKVPKTALDSFQDAYMEYATLYVPASALGTYKAMEPWSNFGKIAAIIPPSHLLTYMVDNKEYKSFEINEGATITPEVEPTKEGYTFSGWSVIPETMPAKDVTIMGSFVINRYKLIYKVDDKVHKTLILKYGASITPEVEPTKEGYTFSGWSEIPATMPAKDVTVTGSFTFVDAIEDIIVNNDDYQIYTTDGKHIETLQKGVNIIRYSDGTSKKVYMK